MSKWKGKGRILTTSTEVWVGHYFRPTHADMMVVLEGAKRREILQLMIPEWEKLSDYFNTNWKAVLERSIPHMLDKAKVNLRTGTWFSNLGFNVTFILWVMVCWRHLYYGGPYPRMGGVKPRNTGRSSHGAPWCPWCEKSFKVEGLTDAERANDFLVQFITHLVDYHKWVEPTLESVEGLLPALHLLRGVTLNRPGVPPWLKVLEEKPGNF